MWAGILAAVDSFRATNPLEEDRSWCFSFAGTQVIATVLSL